MFEIIAIYNGSKLMRQIIKSGNLSHHAENIPF